MSGASAASGSAGLMLSVTTPENWWDLPLDSGTRGQQIGHLVALRTAGSPLADRARAIAALLERAAEAAAGAGAVFASQFGVLGSELAASASLVVAVHGTFPGGSGHGTEVAMSPGFLARAVSGCAPGESGVRVDEVDLPAGRAVRRRFTARAEWPGTGVLATCCVQHFLPAPTYGALVVLSGSATGTDDPDDVAPMFDAIAATVRIGPGDDAATATPDRRDLQRGGGAGMQSGT